MFLVDRITGGIPPVSVPKRNGTRLGEAIVRNTIVYGSNIMIKFVCCKLFCDGGGNFVSRKEAEKMFMKECVEKNK